MPKIKNMMGYVGLETHNILNMYQILSWKLKKNLTLPTTTMWMHGYYEIEIATSLTFWWKISQQEDRWLKGQWNHILWKRERKNKNKRQKIINLQSLLFVQVQICACPNFQPQNERTGSSPSEVLGGLAIIPWGKNQKEICVVQKCHSWPRG